MVWCDEIWYYNLATDPKRVEPPLDTFVLWLFDLQQSFSYKLAG